MGSGESNFRFSNHLGTGSLYLGFLGSPATFQGTLLFSVAYLAGGPNEDSYTLEQAWQSDDGCLLLLGENLSAASVFEKALRECNLASSTRLVWISNPNAPSSDWTMARFELSPIVDGCRTLERKAWLSLTRDGEGYRLDFAKGCEFSIDDAASTMHIVRGDASPAAQIAFGRRTRKLALDDAGVCVEFAAQAGNTFGFGFVIPGGTDLTDWFESLDVGLRYSYVKPNFVAGGQKIGSARFPVFAAHSEMPALPFSARLVMPQLENRKLTRFETELPQVSYFTTCFRTVAGRGCLFSSKHVALTFASLPERHDALTLVPEGTFDVDIGSLQQPKRISLEGQPSPDDHELLCGSSGAEYIRLPNAVKDYQICLAAGFPAFVAGQMAGPREGDAALTDASTTAWVRFSSQSSSLEYYAQPEGAATLFDATNPVGDAAVPLLPYFPMIAAKLEPGSAAPFLPWIPLAGVAAEDSETARRLEVTAVSPARKAQLVDSRQRAFRAGESLTILPQNARFDENKELTAITPRGLEARFVEGDSIQQWASVQIARLLPPNSGQLKFAGDKGIVEPLLSALLTNQQFLVVSDSDEILRFFPPEADTRVQLGGWEFLPHPETWNAHGTILIVKNADAPLGELAADVGSWTSGAVFNKNVSRTSRTLQTIIADAERRVDELRMARGRKDGPAEGMASDFEYFVDVVVRSADWNGFLFLNTSIGKLPPDLACLRAGIEESKFFAHHLGVTQTLFKNLEDLQSRSTAMFGLILYEDHSPKFGGGSNYAFRVEELAVLFRNSAVRDFRSTIAFYFAEMFGQVPSRPGGGQVDVRMEGVYQRRGDEETYLFSTHEPLVVEFDTGPMHSVTILQGEFETLSADTLEEGSTRCRFSYAGLMELANVSPQESQTGFDLFSFDELGFSDVAVDMTFENLQPRKPVFEFTLEPSQLIEARTTARHGSLYEGFPVKLGRLMSNAGGQPGEQGYMTVNVPLEQSALSNVWYGVELQLALGTLSDVAGNAGVEAGLLLAWGKRPDQFLVGLKLPGSGGSSAELSLLGVLKLQMYSLALRRSPPISTDIRDAKPSWALLMNGMTLKVFGKELPPGGSFDFYLFGNPDPTCSSSSLGWYGAYTRKEGKEADDALPQSVIDDVGWPRIRALERLDVDTAASIVTHQNLLPPTIRRRGRRSLTPTLGD